MKISHKQYSIFLILMIPLVLLSVHFVPVMIVDPLQIFHKAWKRDPYYIKTLRFQAAGIINNIEFESIILGTSMAANFSPKEASKLWNSKFVNISPDGSLLSERAILLKYALEKKKLKHVIISLDGFAEYKTYLESYPVSNYDYLYDNNPFNDIKIYSGREYLKYLPCGYIKSYNKEKPCLKTKTLESLAEWASSPYHSRRFGGLKYWFSNYNNPQVNKALRKILSDTETLKQKVIEKIDPIHISNLIRNDKLVFDNYVLDYIVANPTVQFYLFFPPYSRMQYSFEKKIRPTQYKRYLKRIEYITRKVKDYDNADVYGFDNMEFTNNIANYKDPNHYHQKYNSLILNRMNNKKNILTINNIDDYLKSISSLAEAYDSILFGEKIRCFLSGRNSAFVCANIKRTNKTQP